MCAHNPIKLNPKRCVSCDARLFDANIQVGTVKIKCKCGVVNTIVAEPYIDAGSHQARALNNKTTA